MASPTIQLNNGFRIPTIGLGTYKVRYFTFIVSTLNLTYKMFSRNLVKLSKPSRTRLKLATDTSIAHTCTIMKKKSEREFEKN